MFPSYRSSTLHIIVSIGSSSKMHMYAKLPFAVVNTSSTTAGDAISAFYERHNPHWVHPCQLIKTLALPLANSRHASFDFKPDELPL